METLFIVIGILLVFLGASVCASHMTDRMNIDLAPFTGKEFKPGMFSALPFPMSFVFALSGLVILISVSF